MESILEEEEKDFLYQKYKKEGLPNWLAWSKVNNRQKFLDNQGKKKWTRKQKKK